MNYLTSFFKLHAELNKRVAKNLILFLGDGMSITTLAATRSYLGQKYGHYGEEIKLSFEAFPFTGLAKVCCYLNGFSEMTVHHIVNDFKFQNKQLQVTNTMKTSYISYVCY